MSAVHLRHYFFVYNFQSAKSHYQHQNTHNNRLVGKINPQAVFADFVKKRNFEFKIFCKIFLCDEIPKIKACRKEENPRNNREIVCRHKVGRGESQKCKVLARIEKIGQFYDIQPENPTQPFCKSYETAYNKSEINAPDRGLIFLRLSEKTETIIIEQPIRFSTPNHTA